jgi:hypothetical protein
VEHDLDAVVVCEINVDIVVTRLDRGDGAERTARLRHRA